MKRKTQDRRIQKTRGLLHDALGHLIREKDYDSIVVKEILDRANVGRSTFYMHFRDKDDLLISGIHDILESARQKAPSSRAGAHEDVVWFSLPIFERIHEHRRSGEDRMGARGRAVIHEHLRKTLADRVAGEVKRRYQSRRQSGARIPADLLAQYVASTFNLVLDWWVESRSPLPPRDVDDLFRSLVLPTLAATLQAQRP